ncbi:probable serine/threonine-protein kinase DDB_G0278901 [Drosophila bipectinata]|uniref:probable serine/threonine-protein kinase DDB_G0278901 n=1 Tax=Drosophila bipectinata TaxID=42026 RepID=UPI001C8A72CC|nr:protein new-glue 1-like [Drosophila bipectinata]
MKYLFVVAFIALAIQLAMAASNSTNTTTTTTTEATTTTTDSSTTTTTESSSTGTKKCSKKNNWCGTFRPKKKCKHPKRCHKTIVRVTHRKG